MLCCCSTADVHTTSSTSQPHQVLSGESSWVRVGALSDFPNNGGAAVLYGKSQLAVYNVARRNVSTN